MGGSKNSIIVFLTSFHAVGLAGLFSPREARGRPTRFAWGNDKGKLNF